MRKFLIFAVTALFLGGTMAQGADKPVFVNATFQDVLSRVAGRERESQAIIMVRLKEDPANHQGIFSIEPAPQSDGRIAVKLFSRSMEGDTVYESYLLKPDAAIRQELDNQQRMRENAKQREIESFAQLKRSIAELSDGSLSYGMSFDEVVKIKGQPQSTSGIGTSAQQSQPPSFNAIYGDMEITFSGSPREDLLKYAKLVGVKLTSSS